MVNTTTEFSMKVLLLLGLCGAGYGFTAQAMSAGEQARQAAMARLQAQRNVGVPQGARVQAAPQPGATARGARPAPRLLESKDDYLTRMREAEAARLAQGKAEADRQEAIRKQ